MELTSKHTDWLRDFWSNPNQLLWSEIEGRTAPIQLLDQIESWICISESGELLSPIILPKIVNDKIECWYATAYGRNNCQLLHNELQSWLGPSYLSEYTLIDPFTSSDPLASAMHKCFESSVYRFLGPNEKSQIVIATKLKLYRDLLNLRPKLTQIGKRSFGIIRSEFDQALVIQNEEKAQKLRQELVDTGRLNYESQRFLEVRYFAGLKLWPEIARNTKLIKELTEYQLPPIVISDIFEALYRIHIKEYEQCSDSNGLLDAFSTQIANQFPGLFKFRKGIRTQSVVKSFILFEKTLANPDYDRMEELLKLIPNDDHALELYKQFSEKSSEVEDRIKFDEAQYYIEIEQFERAFDLLIELPLELKVLRCLLECVFYTNDYSTKRKLIEKIDRTPEINSILKPKIKEQIEKIRNNLGDSEFDAQVSSIDSWMNWAQLLVDNKIELARKSIDNCVSWDSRIFHEDIILSNKFADLIGNLMDSAEVVMRHSMPKIVEQIFKNEIESIRAASKPIATTLFDNFTISEKYGGTELEFISMLLDIIFELGMEQNEYSSILTRLIEIQEMVGSVEHLAWSLDICEKLVINASPGPDANEIRRQFFHRVVTKSKSFASRIKKHDRIVFDHLRKDFEESEEYLGNLRVANNDEQEIDTPDLSGKKIGIYTLSESAGKRAVHTLEEMFPGVRVEINSDKVATQKLESLAKNSHIFIFAWRSSSHQAFYCIKDSISKHCIFVNVPGKGTSSIIKSLINEIK